VETVIEILMVEEILNVEEILTQVKSFGIVLKMFWSSPATSPLLDTAFFLRLRLKLKFCSLSFDSVESVDRILDLVASNAL